MQCVSHQLVPPWSLRASSALTDTSADVEHVTYTEVANMHREGCVAMGTQVGGKVGRTQPVYLKLIYFQDVCLVQWLLTFELILFQIFFYPTR